jgi:hypothetical protein
VGDLVNSPFGNVGRNWQDGNEWDFMEIGCEFDSSCSGYCPWLTLVSSMLDIGFYFQRVSYLFNKLKFIVFVIVIAI